MKCFVTGATGHLGNVLVKKLYKTGYEVTALVLPNDSHVDIIEPYAHIVYGNILDYTELKNQIKGHSLVFHLAGIVDIGTFKAKKIYKVNVLGTQNVIKACQETNVKRLLYTSSVHAFEEAKKGVVMSEPEVFDYTKVKGNYAKTKALATTYVLNQDNPNLETVVVCPSGIIGPYDYHLSNTGQMFIDFLLGRLTAYIKGSYNFVDVRDVANGMIKAAQKGKNQNVYLLTGHNISVKDLLDKLSAFTGLKKVKTRLARWFVYLFGFFAELYYTIRGQKPLFTRYSIKVLGSNDQFTSEKAINELGYTIRPIDETIEDNLDFAMDFYFIKRIKKKKSLTK